MNFGRNTIVSLLSLGLLAGAAVDMQSLAAPNDAGPYHERIRESRKQIPERVGDWIGEDAPLPPAAAKMLRPNVHFCKNFKNVVTGRRATILLVQCGDARDLLSHYPPICYVAQGYRKMSGKPKDWQVGDLTIKGMEYEFEFRTFQKSESMHVANFMIMPDGRTQRDMDSVEAQASDLQKRFYGAAQVQVITDVNYPPQERDEIFKELVSGYRTIIDTIRLGVK